MPKRLNDLLELPGVGPYAAAAYLSLHRGERFPIIDNNITRHYSRLLGKPYKAETRRAKWVRIFAEKLTPYSGCKEFNYALIDFTRLICSIKPRCENCPLVSVCVEGKKRTVQKN